MDVISKVIVLTVSFAILQFVEATNIAESAIEMVPNEVHGCPPLNPLIRCIRFDKQCETETNSPCSGAQICCPNECGTSCKTPTYIKPSPIRGCPAYNEDIRCIWFNKQCDDSENPCPSGSICCGNNCGTFCVEKKMKCKPNPVKGCPPIDTTIYCIRNNDQCNETNKCPDGSICCVNSCGKSCVKRGRYTLEL